MTRIPVPATRGKGPRRLLAAVAAIVIPALAASAFAQGMMQLVAIAPEYKLGHFRYEAPRVDGWRQDANAVGALSLIYAEQGQEGAINIRFGLVAESAAIPPDAGVKDAATLAETSRRQMEAQRKPDILEVFPPEPVPSVENLYHYRFRVRTPSPENPTAYELYYVLMAPDRSEYVVMQGITRTEQYKDELYYMQFYGSLASLKWQAGDAATPSGSAAPAAPAASAPSAPAATPPASGAAH